MSAAEPLPEQNIKPVAIRRPRAVTPTSPSPLDIVQSALASGNVEMYREAVALMKDMDAFAARKAFNNALADAKAELPVIRKNRLVDFESNGKRTTYMHEDLAEVVATVVPILSKFGLNHRWRTAGKPGEPVTVTCIISHRDGHQEENDLSAGADTSGGKNAIQGVKSAVSYLERITLMAALGLASKADDDDGRGTHAAEPEVYFPSPGSITQDQVDFIRDALAEKGAAATAFLQWAAGKGMFAGRKQRLEELPAQHYAASINAIANFKKA
jgi:hypothetical protein